MERINGIVKKQDSFANYQITQPGQARTKKKKNLPTEMKSHRNEFLLFLILRDFNSEN